MVGIALKIACTATKFKSLSVRVQTKQTKTAGQLVLSRTRRCAWICPTPAPSSPTGSLKFPSPSPIRRHYTPTRTQTQKTTRKANATKAQFRSVVMQLRAYILLLGIMGDAVVTILSDNYGYRGYNAPCRFARRVSTLKCASVLRTKG